MVQPLPRTNNSSIFDNMISWPMTITRTSLNIRALWWAVILCLLVLVHHFQNNSLFTIGLQEKEQQRSSSSNCDCSGKISSTVESSNIHAVPGDDNINNEKAFTSTSNTSTASSIQHKSSLDTDTCRDIFRTKGQGGAGEMSASQIAGRCKETHTYNVCDDLLHFTGLSKDEFQTRMQRKGRFHFEGEHAFWNPKSKTELTWYYATSIDYLFANALHPVPGQLVKNSAMLKSKNLEPILEYSGGVGNNVLHLAKLGLKVQYFGIGMAEYNFAQYRVWKHGYDHLVEFKKPYSEKTGYVFDPISSPLPQDESLGAILAFDVLEHIPDYHVVVQKMVKSIRVGGVIFENTPFEASSIGAGAEDLRVHLTNGGITMKEAMGTNMKFLGNGRWDKVKSD